MVICCCLCSDDIEPAYSGVSHVHASVLMWYLALSILPLIFFLLLKHAEKEENWYHLVGGLYPLVTKKHKKTLLKKAVGISEDRLEKYSSGISQL